MPLGAALLTQASAAAQPVELHQIKAIHIPADADAAECPCQAPMRPAVAVK